MKRSIATATVFAALIAAPVMAQDAAAPATNMAAQTELVGNMGKIEANIAEAHSRLFTHMLLAADDDAREDYAQRYAEDVASVDEYLALVQASDVPEGALTQIEGFATEWTGVKEMGTALTANSRDDLASVEDIKAYSDAVLGLDDYIDEALEAAGLPDDDD